MLSLSHLIDTDYELFNNSLYDYWASLCFWVCLTSAWHHLRHFSTTASLLYLQYSTPYTKANAHSPDVSAFYFVSQTSHFFNLLTGKIVNWASTLSAQGGKATLSYTHFVELLCSVPKGETLVGSSSWSFKEYTETYVLVLCTIIARSIWNKTSILPSAHQANVLS